MKKGRTGLKNSNGDLVAKWKDKRDVLYISSQYENLMDKVKNKRGEKRIKLPVSYL